MYLKESMAAGDKISLYRDMLQNPMSYMELVAELDWAARLRKAGGIVKPHPKTHSDLKESVIDPAQGGKRSSLIRSRYW
jgi:hypothetical protein